MEKYKIMEALTLIYDLTKDGNYGGFRKHGKSTLRIANLLVNRGILIRTGNRGSTKYAWFNNSQPPTRTLCDNIAQDLATLNKEENAARRSRRSVRRIEKALAQAIPPQASDDRRALKEFTDKELIEELFFRRGFEFIETDGRTAEVSYRRTIETTMTI